MAGLDRKTPYLVPLVLMAAMNMAAIGGELQSHAALKKLETKWLPNTIQLNAKVLSGGQPDGEAGFAELQALGVKTIISVDGAVPDLSSARKFGLRYVHLPHGYDGIPPARVRELAKAVRDFDGPIYIHCHHGKHRSPAAAAVACVSASLMQPEDSMAILALAGTSESYRGLLQSVATATRLEDAELDAVPGDFPQIAKLTPMAEAMVAIERSYERLAKSITASRRHPFKKIGSAPEADPAHEALLMVEQFTELSRTLKVDDSTNDFKAWLAKSEAEARQLELIFRESKTISEEREKSKLIVESLERLSIHCSGCHRQYRDRPIEFPIGSYELRK